MVSGFVNAKTGWLKLTDAEWSEYDRFCTAQGWYEAGRSPHLSAILIDIGKNREGYFDGNAYQS